MNSDSLHQINYIPQAMTYLPTLFILCYQFKELSSITSVVVENKYTDSEIYDHSRKPCFIKLLSAHKIIQTFLLYKMFH